MLKGSLKETQYGWPDKDILEEGRASPLHPRSETLVARNEVTYIADSVSIDTSLRTIGLADTGEARSP